MIFGNITGRGVRGGRGVVFAGGREMTIFSTVFRDFGKNMVGKRYLDGAGNYRKKQREIGI